MGVGIPGVLMGVGISGVLMGVGISGVLMGVGIPGVLMGVGIPGVLMGVEMVDIFGVRHLTLDLNIENLEIVIYFDMYIGLEKLHYFDKIYG